MRRNRQRKHLPAMKKSGLYEIVAFCDIVRERAEKAKEEYGTEDGGTVRHTLTPSMAINWRIISIPVSLKIITYL